MTPSLGALSGMHPIVRKWFQSTFDAPTPAQRAGWPLIRQGVHTLIVAPTGTGKTLAAFLQCISWLCNHPEASKVSGVKILYISPLKSLGRDIQHNLSRPLGGIKRLAARDEVDIPDIRVAVRTGDTPQRARRQMVSHPPDILITTPESFYLILSSPKAREILRPVQYVIVDEIHSIAGSKRGVHLSLSLERLEILTQHTPVRVGLSATVNPQERLARFLAGYQDGKPRPVKIADGTVPKQLDLTISTIPRRAGRKGAASFWPEVYQRLLHLLEQHQSTLIFVSSRRQAERVALGINELAGKELVKTHHGSLAPEERQRVERDFKKGRLTAVAATSSLELGMDIGFVDLVVQIDAPKSASQGLQRAGRSGHSLGSVSKIQVIAHSGMDLLEAAVVGHQMLLGEIEETKIPRNCLDVLAQQIIACGGVEEWPIEDLWQLIRRSYCYSDLSRKSYDSILEVLSGRQTSDLDTGKPRLVWDRSRNVVRSRPGAAILARTGGGTIPDRAYYPVHRAEDRSRLGELEEEFVYESRPGDVFTLGTSTWRIVRIEDSRVLVKPSPGSPPAVPFWKGDRLGRPSNTCHSFGDLFRALSVCSSPDRHRRLLRDWAHLDDLAADELSHFLQAQEKATGRLPSDECLVVEQFAGELGEDVVVIHSLFGRRVNTPWQMALSAHLKHVWGLKPGVVCSDNGIAFRFRSTENRRFDSPAPIASLVKRMLQLDPKAIERYLLDELPRTPLFASFFRKCAQRALLLGRSRPGKRLPLWLQRLRSADMLEEALYTGNHPIVREALREVLEDFFDLPSLRGLIERINSHRIQLLFCQRPAPSPFAVSFLAEFVDEFMYADDATPEAEKRAGLLQMSRQVARELTGITDLSELLVEEAVRETLQRRCGLDPKRIKSADDLEAALLRRGEISLQEVELSLGQDGLRAIGELQRQDRVRQIQINGRLFVVPADELATYAVLEGRHSPQTNDGHAREETARQEALKRIICRFARSFGPFSKAEVSSRYGIPKAQASAILSELVEEGLLHRGRFTPRSESAPSKRSDDITSEYCHVDVLQEMRRRSIQVLRRRLKPVSAEQYTCFLLAWMGVKAAEDSSLEADQETLLYILADLQGLCLPLQVWEKDILPKRLPGYTPALLDRLLQLGRIYWYVSSASSQEIRITFRLRDERIVGNRPKHWPDGKQQQRPASSAESLPNTQDQKALAEVTAVLEERGPLEAEELAIATGQTLTELEGTLWRGVLAGTVTSDTLEPLRQYEQGPASGRQAPSRSLTSSLSGVIPERGQTNRRSARYRIRSRMSRTAALTSARWLLFPPALKEELDPQNLTLVLLSRYGVVSRDLLAAEPGDTRSWEEIRPVLDRLELRGEVRGGHFVSGFSGLQYADLQAAEELRSNAAFSADTAVLLSACDPALLWGSVFPIKDDHGQQYSLARIPANYAVVAGGKPVLLVLARGKRLLPLVSSEDETLETAVACLKELVQGPAWRRRLDRIVVEEWAGRPVLGSPGETYLRRAGFQSTGVSMELWYRP